MANDMQQSLQTSLAAALLGALGPDYGDEATTASIVCVEWLRTNRRTVDADSLRDTVEWFFRDQNISDKDTAKLLADTILSELPGHYACGVAAFRNGTPGGGDPPECDWPACGCDPYASAVISNLEESGVIPSEPPPDAGTAWDANEVWETLFGIFKGAVPEEITDEKCAEIAAAINASAPIHPQGVIELGLRVSDLPAVRAQMASIGTEIAGLQAVLSTKAAQDILAERHRQVFVERFDSRHDDKHTRGELVSASMNYAAAAAMCARLDAAAFGADQDPPLVRFAPPLDWPWARNWWKPGTVRAMLVKAAALLLAEIERLDRKG